MPDRILRESIRTSESINQLTAFEETFFYRMMVSCDDQGYMVANPKALANICFPLKDVRESQIKDALRALSSAELVSFFKQEDGKLFVRLTTWDKYQGSGTAAAKPKKPVRKSKLPPATLERFERFWKVYPRKEGKGKAEESFGKYKPDDALTDTMIQAVQAYKKTEQWKRDGGQFIPHPATWLNQRRWEDSPKTIDTEPDALKSKGLEDWDG